MKKFVGNILCLQDQNPVQRILIDRGISHLVERLSHSLNSVVMLYDF